MGVRLAAEGFGVLRRERSLWSLAWVPLLLCAGALLGTFGAVVIHAAQLYAFTSGWLPVLEAHAWYAWLWVAPARVVLWLVGLLLFAGLAGVLLVMALLVANLLASPFLDALSRRVEDRVTGGVVDRSPGGVHGLAGDALRAVVLELRRGVFFAAVQGGLFLAALALPGGVLLGPPAMLLFTTLFLPLDYAGYTHDRRRVPFRARRRWVLAHRARMLGFGGAAFATLLVPGLNFLALPGMVVSGTLLALRTPIPEAAEAGVGA